MELDDIKSKCFGLLGITRLCLWGKSTLDGFFMKNLRNVFPNLVVLEIGVQPMESEKVFWDENDMIKILKIMRDVQYLKTHHLGVFCETSRKSLLFQIFSSAMEIIKNFPKERTEISITVTHEDESFNYKKQNDGCDCL